MKKEMVRRLWNPIFHAAVELMDKPDEDLVVAWYTQIVRLLASQMESGDSRLRFSRRRAALNVWLGMIGATLNLNTARNQ